MSRQAVDRLSDQVERSVDLLVAHPLARQGIPLVLGVEQLVAELAVRGVWTCEANVFHLAGGTRQRPKQGERVGGRGRNDPRSTEAVDERRCVQQEAQVGAHRPFDLVDGSEDLRRPKARGAAHPTGHDHASTESTSAQARSQTLDPLFVVRQPGVGDRLPGGLGVADRRVQVVGDPLEFGVDDTYHSGLAQSPRLRRSARPPGSRRWREPPMPRPRCAQP